MQPSRACAVLCNPKRSACVFLLMQGLVCSCAMPRRQTPEHVRAAVLALRGSGLSNVAIANKYKLTEAGVRYIFKTYKDGDVSTRKRAGRPPKCSVLRVPCHVLKYSFCQIQKKAATIELQSPFLVCCPPC